MSKSRIGYLDEVWNAYSSHCQKVSEGCKHCYAERRAKKYGTVFAGNPQFDTEKALAKLKAIKAGTVVGVNFLTDTWHGAVDVSVIAWLHEQIALRPQNVFLYTTKRAERLAEYAHKLDWPQNLWVGVSVEANRYLSRLDCLRAVPTPNRWVSFEPLLEQRAAPDLRGIRWVVTGGESGLQRRAWEPAFARAIRDLCIDHSIPYYHKQGGAQHPDQDRVLDGRTWDDLPAAFLAVQDVVKPPKQMGLF